MNPDDIRILADPVALARAVADALVEVGSQAAAARGRFLLALNGGGTPQRLFELLGQLPYRAMAFWEKAEIFWGDERCVPADHPDSNFRQAHDAFLQHLAIPERQIHRIPGEKPPKQAAAFYETVLAWHAEAGMAWPRFDLVLLGLGKDGHTASLLPCEVAGDPGETVRAVSVRYENRPADRVTLMPAVFNSARMLFWMIEGKGKAEITRTVLHDDPDPDNIPAQRIRLENGLTVWWLDRAASGGINPAEL